MPEQPRGRARPSGALLAFLRLPPLFYRLGLARALGPRLLLLTTTGRRTGRPRSCGLNYARDGDVVYVISGWGPGADWYRNLVAEPRVRVQIGERIWAARAAAVDDAERRRAAVRLLRGSAGRQGPPKVLRPALGLIGLDYDAELRELDDDAAGMPVVALVPVEDREG